MEAHTLQCADNLDHALTLIYVHNSEEHVLQAMCRVAYMIRHGVLLNVETFATNNVDEIIKWIDFSWTKQFYIFLNEEHKFVTAWNGCLLVIFRLILNGYVRQRDLISIVVMVDIVQSLDAI